MTTRRDGDVALSWTPGDAPSIHDAPVVESSGIRPCIQISEEESGSLPPPPTLHHRRHQAGEVFAGRYRLDALIGEGGMGAVWRAHCLVLGQDVAVKVVRADVGGPRSCARLAREARTAASLAHPSIVRAIDFGTTSDDEPFLVMELLDGPSLTDWLAKQGRVKPTNAVRLALPLASALGAAHALGAIHRDVKPGNVIVTRGPGGTLIPKLVDFGIVKMQDDQDPRAIHTDSGTLIGSLDYMSPEQVEGVTQVDGRSDQWAFCVLLYEMLTGHRPFGGPSQRAIIFSIFAGDPEPITTWKAGDEELWAIVRRGIEKYPAALWPSMADLGRALAAWALARGVTTDATGAPLDRWLGDGDAEAEPSIPSAPPAPDAATADEREEIHASLTHFRLARALTAIGLVGALAVGARAYAGHGRGSTDGAALREAATAALGR
jgi:serine/threonine-protein kinase